MDLACVTIRVERELKARSASWAIFFLFLREGRGGGGWRLGNFFRTSIFFRREDVQEFFVVIVPYFSFLWLPVRTFAAQEFFFVFAQLPSPQN